MLQPITGEFVSATDSPKDCVKIHRTVADWVALVGYDENGEVQIEVRIRRGRMSERWESWLLRWMRGWYRAALKLVK